MINIWNAALLLILQSFSPVMGDHLLGGRSNVELCLHGSLQSLTATRCNRIRSGTTKSLMDGIELLWMDEEDIFDNTTSPRFKLRNPDKNLCLSHLQTVERSSSIYYSECDQNLNNDNLWIFYEPVAESEDVYYLASSKTDVNECIGTCQDMQQLQLVSGCENNHERVLIKVKVKSNRSTLWSTSEGNSAIGRYLKEKHKKQKLKKKNKLKAKKAKKKKKGKKGKTKTQAPSSSPSTGPIPNPSNIPTQPLTAFPSDLPDKVETVVPTERFSQDTTMLQTSSPSFMDDAVSYFELISNLVVIALLFGGVNPGSLSSYEIASLEHLLKNIVTVELEKYNVGVLLDSVKLLNAGNTTSEESSSTLITLEDPFVFQFKFNHFYYKRDSRRVQNSQMYSIVVDSVENAAEVLAESINATTVTVIETPSNSPTSHPSSGYGLEKPSLDYTRAPSNSSTTHPSRLPSETFSEKPSHIPSISNIPMRVQSQNPSNTPTSSLMPSAIKSVKPSEAPDANGFPSTVPRNDPTLYPRNVSSNSPTLYPTLPRNDPTLYPRNVSSNSPTLYPTLSPTKSPSFSPSSKPSPQFSNNPSLLPTYYPTNIPSLEPSPSPTISQQPSQEPTILIQTTIVALLFDGVDPLTMSCDESDDLVGAMSTFVNNTLDEGMYLLSLTITNDNCARRRNQRSLQGSSEPLLFEIEAYISSDYDGRYLRRGIGFLYGAVTIAIASQSSALISEVQNSNPAFSNVIGVLQIEPPSTVPTSSPSGLPSSSPSSNPTREPSSTPSLPPSTSHSPTRVSSEIPTSAPTLTSPPTTSFQPTADVPSWMVEMLNLVNEERAKVGSLPLCYNGKLIAAAITHTSDMVRNDFFSHIGSDGSAPSDRVTVAFYTWDAVAENIAWGQRSVASVMNSWMNSPGHRSNILSNSYRHFGVAENNSKWTQVFGNSNSEDCQSSVASMPPSTSRFPSDFPSKTASLTPSSIPSRSPSGIPSLSRHPSDGPTMIPSNAPSNDPSSIPSPQPSRRPSSDPSLPPSDEPSNKPSSIPSILPSISHLPSDVPSQSPTDYPSNIPSSIPSFLPSYSPSDMPSLSWMPSSSPSISFIPSMVPSLEPSFEPSISHRPSISMMPSVAPSTVPSTVPTATPSLSSEPTAKPSLYPSSPPSVVPSTNPSGEPSFSPSTSSIPSTSSAPTSHPVSYLERAILEDIFSSDTSSSQCSGGGSTSRFTFDFSPPDDDSKWHSEARKFEKDVFLVEMRHTDDDDKSWTIRIGEGGNIYSFVGPFGESVPPQTENGAAYIDDVWQNICLTMKTFENYDYYVYQSGVYQDDVDYLSEKPFYSPNLAKYCDGDECSFASWNQQAIVPTTWESPVLSFNRYKDCGDGVLEMTSIIYNDVVGDLDSLVYLNMPRAGIRASNLKDILFSSSDGTNAKPVEPLQDYLTGQAHLVNQDDTGGYAIFAEDVVSENSTGEFEMPIDSDGNIFSLVMDGNYGNICQSDEYMSEYFGRYLVICNIRAVPLEIMDGCMKTVGCDLYFRNTATNEGIQVYGVLYWAASSTQIYFFPACTADQLNIIFQDGSLIDVTYYETGKPREDQTGLGHVFGKQAPNFTQVLAGTFGDLMRDSLLYTVSVYPDLQSGESLLYRQYFVVDKLINIDNKAASLVPESYQETLPLGHNSGRVVRLFSFDNVLSSFSATVDSFSCGHGRVICSGSTTPQENTRPLYYITCGSKTYLGSDAYALSPDGSIRRPYVCDEAFGTRPTFNLLGFFEEGSCQSLISANYLHSLCSELTDVPSFIPSVLPSDNPSQLPSISPSISLQPTDTSPLNGLLIPLYVYPDVDLNGNCISNEYIQVASGAAAAKTIVIVNPNNGPTYSSTEHKSSYDSCISYLRSHGVEVIGYIHTKSGYPNISSYRSIAEVKADIVYWYEEYDVDGIFVDEVSNRWTHPWDSEELARSTYQEIIDFVLNAKGFSRVVLNPGSPYFESIIEPWFGDSRLISIVFENSQDNYQPTTGCLSLLRDITQGEFGPGPWCSFVPNWDNVEPLKNLMDDGTISKEQSAAIMYSSKMDALQTGLSIDYNIQNNIGWAYITNKNTWGGLADQVVFDAQSHKAMNYEFELSSVPSSVPSTAPTSSPSGMPSLIPFIGTSLDAALLEDLLPPSSPLCEGSSSTTFSFDFTEKDPMKWVSMSRGYEADVFLAEMEHIDSNNNRTWSIRIGSGSNIYSFVGPFGEAVPPQWHANAPWIDEVWQTVAVNLGLNKPEISESYFIHQAGSYQRDGNYTETNPFFSPNLAKYCKGNECSFASWGQHGHVPTSFESSALYYNRYKDCGDGVLEFTSLIHNSADLPSTDNDYLSYLNVPWGGVRTTVLKDLLISDKSGGSTIIDEIPKWDDVGLVPDVSNTGGYTIWAEDLESHSPVASFEIPCASENDCLDLVLASGGCVESPSHYDSHGIYTMKCSLVQTASISTGCRLAIGCDVLFINESTGASVHVLAVMHWAWKGTTMYFHPSVQADEFNEKFSPGDKILIETYQTGKSFDDNLALALVHGAGAFDNSWMRSRTRLRYGIGGDIYRSYTAYCVNPNPKLTAGNTYYFRQYFIVDQLNVMDDRASSLSSEAYEEMVSIGTIPGRSVSLFSTIDNIYFGATVSSESCGEAILRCTGNTTPLPTHRPLYYIRCGDSSYVGSNLYAFAPDGNPRRPYVCKDQPNVRATWKLLGFFEEGSCAFLSSSMFDDNYCTDASFQPTSTPSKIPSFEPSDSPTMLPSKSAVPSVSTFPSSIPTTTESATPSSITTEPTFTPSSTPSFVKNSQN